MMQDIFEIVGNLATLFEKKSLYVHIVTACNCVNILAAGQQISFQAPLPQILRHQPSTLNFIKDNDDDEQRRGRGIWPQILTRDEAALSMSMWWDIENSPGLKRKEELSATQDKVCTFVFNDLNSVKTFQTKIIASSIIHTLGRVLKYNVAKITA